MNSCTRIKVFFFNVIRKMTWRWMPDGLYLRMLYRMFMGKRLHLRNPRLYSEKIQWLKIYNRKPEYTMMVDKYAVKEYVSRTIGKEHVIPTLGVWESPEDIDFDTLPDQFVLKTTHGGGSSGVVLCRNKDLFDRVGAVNKLKKAMHFDLYRASREWPYKNVPRRIISEMYLAPAVDASELVDYKFFCFNGEPKYCQVISGREGVECSDFFDKEWNHQPFHEPQYLPFSDVEIARPKHLKSMWQSAELLAKNIAFSRIDFYDTGDEYFFGEITFFPTSGFGGFDPEEYDKVFGDMIRL